MNELRILVVDDHEDFRRCIRSLISEQSDWLICGEARDGVEAIEKARDLRPDLVLMDVSMPRMNGLEATKIIRRETPESEVIIISQNDPKIVSEQAKELNAQGYMTKMSIGKDLIPMIDRIMGEHRKERQKLGSQDGMPQLHAQVRERFGVLPNFFQLAPETPEITANLWGFTQAAYLDNPLPSLFKERLFVYLSRFCEVRYCIARHLGFLIGLGSPSGDAQCRPQTADEVMALLRRPLARGEQLAQLLSRCSKSDISLEEMPAADSEAEQAIFAFASHVFLQTQDAPACVIALAVLFGAVRLQYLILFLAFIRTAHYWSEVHPELAFEDDVKELLATHEALAKCILKDPEARAAEVGRKLIDELPLLRQEAQRATSLLAAIVDSSDDAIISKDLNGVITSWNKGAERLFGYEAKDAVGKNIMLIIPPDRLQEEPDILAGLSRGERVEHFETVRVTKDGRTLDISLMISPIRDASGRVVGASKVARDITQRKQAERLLRQNEERMRQLADGLEGQVRERTKELEERNAEVLAQANELQELSNRLMQSQDSERRLIARELHDSSGQIVAVLGLNLANMAQRAGHDPWMDKLVQDSIEQVQQLNKEIRTVSYLLHPPLLDESGLSGAIRWYVEGLAQRSGLQIELEIAEDFGRLPHEMELAVFRIVQECLTNIHRHSGSKTAMIRIARNPEGVSVEIRDEGTGMPAEKLASLREQRSGVGIAGMRERVKYFKGSMNIESSGKGTKISVRLPVEKAGVSEGHENGRHSQAVGSEEAANLSH
jgi:PAS domain S-box-containing protein